LGCAARIQQRFGEVQEAGEVARHGTAQGLTLQQIAQFQHITT
jgi:hypothetical protein